jgi:L-seryl-tRNA(Ser) seleniumtransferase
MSPSSDNELLRRIPAVDQLLARPRAGYWISRTSRSFVLSEIQKLLQELRAEIRANGIAVSTDPEWLDGVLDTRVRAQLRPLLRPVINATGVILHTNLGRAPLSRGAQESLSALSGQYTNLEFDLVSGERSDRGNSVDALLRDLLVCEAALVVNNNAAAVFLILNTLAAKKEVVVSRGELVEIGGSFRIPDIMARSGAVLREVGTTNKTRAGDYEQAIGPETGLILRVHPSNFRISGFTERPALSELVEISRRHAIPLVEDVGSGCLIDLQASGVSDEPLARESLETGADVVCFSADKLLGGPQAGIIAGARRWLEPMRRNPLMRVLRVEKLIYGALASTLSSYRTGRAIEEIPVLRMLAATREEIAARAQNFCRLLAARLPAGCEVAQAEGNSVVGGGSCPGTEIATILVTLRSRSLGPNAIESRLRAWDPPVVIRVENDTALIDLRTVLPGQESQLLDAISAVLNP